MDDEWSPDGTKSFEDAYVSDLYYADVYRYNNISKQVEFEDWDSNGNGVFGEWKDNDSKDVVDLIPDVIVGRLPCRNIFEANNVVKKIIRYENGFFMGDWFKRMILVGGDTSPGNESVYEGEAVTDKSAGFMSGYDVDVVALWTSTQTLSSNNDVIAEMNKGAGFMHFAGHGNPTLWGTHPPDDNDSWIYGLNNKDMIRLRNRFRLPIVVVGGCHNCQFNVSVLNIIKGLKKEGSDYFSQSDPFGSFWKYEWAPVCWGWNLVSNKRGGSIASIGNTGLGWGYGGNDTVLGLSGWIGPRFFESIGVDGNQTLGEAHSHAVSEYVQTFDTNHSKLDRKTVEQWVLLGDPSLKIGGYN